MVEHWPLVRVECFSERAHQKNRDQDNGNEGDAMDCFAFHFPFFPFMTGACNKTEVSECQDLDEP
jgi:hypothetical protein